MYITTKSVEISFHDEDVRRLCEIIYSAKHGIEQSIKDHYISLQGNGGLDNALRVFREQNNGRINTMQDISDVVNGPKRIREDLEEFLAKEYKNKHGEEL